MDLEIEELFRSEAQEHIETIEAELLKLEDDTNQSESLDTIFRALHTLKGSGNMAGYANIGTFVHNIETKFSDYRKSKLALGKEFVSEFLNICDILREMLKAGPESKPSNFQSERLETKKSVKESKSSDPSKKDSQKKEVLQKPSAETGVKLNLTQSLSQAKTYDIEFKPSPHFFLEGMSPVAIINSLSNLGKLKVEQKLSSIPSLAQCDPELCFLHFNFILESQSSLEEILDIFAFAPRGSSIKIAGKQYGTVEHDSANVVPGNSIRGLHCRVGELHIIVPEFCIRACRPPTENIQRPLGITDVDGKQETVVDLPTLFNVPASEDRVLVLVDLNGQKFCLSVENFEDFVEGVLYSGGFNVLLTEGVAGFLTNPQGEIQAVLDMDWFETKFSA